MQVVQLFKDLLLEDSVAQDVERRPFGQGSGDITGQRDARRCAFAAHAQGRGGAGTTQAFFDALAFDLACQVIADEGVARRGGSTHVRLNCRPAQSKARTP